jgi:ribonuclease-3
MTEIRSRIVSRESLNQLGRKMGLGQVIELDKAINVPHNAVYGDTLEAIIGAVYLDRGFDYCRKFVLSRLIEPFYDIDELINIGQNSKSRIIEWTQKENKKVLFETVNIKDLRNRKEFTVQIIIDDDVTATGYGHTKKKAEQDASQKAIQALNLD